MRSEPIMIAAVFASIWLPAVPAQTSRPDRQQEWFIRSEPVRREDGSFSGILCQLRCFDPATGKKVDLQECRPQAPSAIVHGSLLDAQGRRKLQLQRTGDFSRGAGRIELVMSQEGAPKRAFEELEVKRMRSPTLSPDGGKIVFFDYRERRIVLGGETSFTAIPAKWWITRPFSWSPDSTRVAFYYAPSSDQDDIHVQQHGVAVLNVDGELRELVRADREAGTPDSPTAKGIPPGWGNSGRFVYYTAGLGPDDPDRGTDAARVLFPPTRTCRVDVETGRIEPLALGVFCDVSPDEQYVLVSPSPQRTPEGTYKAGPSKVVIGTREVTYLPELASTPRLSPSGDFAACIRGDGIRFFRTSDWQQIGELVPLDAPVSAERIGAEFRWITVEDEEAFRRQFATQPAP